MYYSQNPFVIHMSADERLRDWRELRNRVGEFIQRDDGEAALQIVAEFWAYAPLVNFTHDPELPQEWPTVWELVSRGNWSPDMIPVGMEATLRLAGWEGELEIIGLRDYTNSREITVLKIDHRYALNYTVGEVEVWPNSEIMITSRIGFRGRGYQNLG